MNRKLYTLGSFLLAVILAVTLSGCADVFLPKAGNEGQPCLDDGTCKPGLVCSLENTCIKGGADGGDDGGLDGGDDVGMDAGDGCTDECNNSGDTQCDGNMLQTCTEGVSGCLSWVNSDCGACKICVGAGICQDVGNGQDPKDDCWEEDPATCGTTGVCNGSGDCERFGSDTACDDSNTCTFDDFCDGNGNCIGTNQPDFTSCSVVTSPNDYQYDICVDGVCVSPGGCGEAVCNSPGPHFPLPDTNQRSCFSDSTEIACPGTPGAIDCGITPHCGQDAQYGWDTAYIPSERFSTTELVAGEPVVEDRVTGLSWQGCTAGLRGTDCSVDSVLLHSWQEALSYCDSLNWGGHNDWYLPDEFAILSIVDYGAVSPLIDTTAFPNTPTGSPDGLFWSSSSCESDPLNAWLVSFVVGTVLTDRKNIGLAVRCTRREVAFDYPPQRYVRSENTPGQPIIEDRVAGLTWQGCPAGLNGTDCQVGVAELKNWETAISHCEDLTWDGSTDWYLPNAKELFAIVDNGAYSPALDQAVFPESSGGFWSSTTIAGNTSLAWYVDFLDGSLMFNGSKSEERRVRCVQTGSCPGVFNETVTRLQIDRYGQGGEDGHVGGYLFRYISGCGTSCANMNVTCESRHTNIAIGYPLQALVNSTILIPKDGKKITMYLTSQNVSRIEIDVTVEDQ